jgi:hypothetical protein
MPHKDIAARREYFRKYREANREKANPEKVKAQSAVGHAIRDDRLVRQSCEVCDDPRSHGHHRDYSKPLEVTWLCAICHSLVHRVLNVILQRKLIYEGERYLC